MITVSRTQQNKLNSSLGSEKMDTKHEQHTKTHRKSQNFKIRGSGVRAPIPDVRAPQVAESMFSENTKGVRTPSRGVRTDHSGLPPRLRGRPDTSRVPGRISFWNLTKIENFETFWLERIQFSPPHLNLTLSPM